MAHILRLMEGKKPLYPVCLDVEDGCQKGLSKEALTEIVYTILTRIEAAGYYAMLYANKDWLENRLDMDRLGRFDVWLAQWKEEPAYEGQFGIWQYSSEGVFRASLAGWIWTKPPATGIIPPISDSIMSRRNRR